jgi:hypothetical protein
VLALDEVARSDDDRERRAAVDRAVDAVRDRFGDDAVRPATLTSAQKESP